MISRPRIIPTLLIDEGNLVKTKRFRNPNYLGDPINAIKIFNEKGVDELCVLDISASKKGRAPGIYETWAECQKQTTGFSGAEFKSFTTRAEAEAYLENEEKMNRYVKNSDITKSRENVIIRIEDASSEQFNVVVNEIGQEGEGYMVGMAVPEQSLIQINGPASVIAEIRRVVVELNKTGFTTDQIKNCEIKIYDNANNPIDTTYLEYNGKTTGMNVHVTMFKKKIVRLRVDYSGKPADGYSFQELTFKPDTLEIAGTVEDIAELREITIPGEAVNIDGITEDTQVNVDVTKYLPENIRLADDKDASVAVAITLEKKQGKTIRIPVSEIELLNIPKGFNVDFGDLDKVDIVGMGTSAQLAELSEDAILVKLNLEEYSKAGTYKGALEVELPKDYSLMDKAEVEFRLIKRAAAGKK